MEAWEFPVTYESLTGASVWARLLCRCKVDPRQKASDKQTSRNQYAFPKSIYLPTMILGLGPREKMAKVTKKRPTDLAGRISENRKSVKRAGANGKELHPPHGEKGGFIKVTATLAPETYKAIMQEVVRRRMEKEKNGNLSAVIREAVAAYLPGRK